MAGRLGIHVIGAGFGESLVVELPNGGWGVIDCFSQRLSGTHTERAAANPTLRFLKDRGVSRLTFVGLTHPHADHGLGMSDVLAAYAGRVEEVWAFIGYEDVYLAKYFQACAKLGRRLPVEELLDLPAGTWGLEYLRVRAWIDKLTPAGVGAARGGGSEFRWFGGTRSFEIESEPGVMFHLLGPRDDLSRAYVARLADSVAGLIDGTGQVVDPEWEPAEVNHNLISPALMIEWGEARVLLGGDMEEPGWARVMTGQRARVNPGPPLSDCQVVKVSHHGSANGYAAGLYETIARGGKPRAVLTPYNRNRSPLPSAAGLAHVTAWASEVWSTNLAEAVRASGRGGRPRAAPARWLADVAKEEALGWVLAADLRTGVPAAPRPAGMPPAWAADIAAEPRLADLVSDEYRRAVAVPEVGAEERYRVSVYVAADGRAAVEPGTGAGRVP